MIKPNVRIQLFKDGEMTSERLVAQGPEFYNGPKEKHDGPIRIEFTIIGKEDAVAAVNYLNALALDLPLKKMGETRGRKAKELDNDLTFTEDKAELVTRLFNDSDNQDEYIKSLREIGFVFVESGFLTSFIIPEGYVMKDRHLERYQWLVRRTKEAKDPKNDKYDPQVLVGIQIMDKRSDKMVLYCYGEFSKTFSSPIPDKKAMTAQKTNLIKYPHYMEEDERFKWGTEHRLLFNNKDKKPSKFYMRWNKDIEVGDELKIHPSDLLNRLS